MTGIRLTHIGGPTVLIEAAVWLILTHPMFAPPRHDLEQVHLPHRSEYRAT